MKRICLITGMAMLITPLVAQKYIADNEVAKEEVLRSIPKEFIDKARTELHVAYQHTSHGTHVSRGVFGLPDFESGDDVLFSVSTSQQAGKLDFRDYALSSYAPAGIDGSDLSRNETAFIQTTRNYLDAPENADVNVIMWSWCNIAGHDVAGNYLPGMDLLISEYGVAGSKIGTGEGQREVSVTFIFMTGHANVNANVGELKPKSHAALINDHCNTQGYFCLDYYSIDTHDMDGNYWEDAGDNGNSSAYGGNFYEDWQNSHALGTDYFENKTSPGGDATFGAHNTQHITANRKAYAMWWILARIAGWNGNIVSARNVTDAKHVVVFPNPTNGMLYIENVDFKVNAIQIYRIDGNEIVSVVPVMNESLLSIDLSDHTPGVYGLRLITDSKTDEHSTVVLTN
ncbi:MAG: T9SS type A sorting domain-containing protein [Bacteroidales bacterium]|nr:T9SS type A sorting domain-containing protein [Bacteroidales bacterium]